MASSVFEVVEELLCNILNFRLLVAFLASACSETKKIQAPKFLLPFNLKIIKIFKKNQISEFGLWFGLQKNFQPFFSIFLGYFYLIRLKCINSDLKRINFAIEINFVSNWAKHISVSRPPWDRNPKDPRTKYKPTPSLWESIKILYTKMPGLCMVNLLIVVSANCCL